MQRVNVSRLFLAPLFGLVALLALAISPASAGEVFAQDGIAIKGYDAVAYHTESKPVKGDAAHSVKWKGATWHFATAENKNMFEAMPDKYAPAYGGYCAYAVSYGSTAKTEPDAFKIVDGTLYLNYSKNVQKRWEADIPGHLAKSEKNWPDIKKGLKD